MPDETMQEPSTIRVSLSKDGRARKLYSFPSECLTARQASRIALEMLNIVGHPDVQDKPIAAQKRQKSDRKGQIATVSQSVCVGCKTKDCETKKQGETVPPGIPCALRS